jgi:copper chaperone CopZ
MRSKRMKTITFALEDGNEELYKEIEVSLTNMDGIERALIDVNDGEMMVEYNEDVVDTVKVKQAIESQGSQIKQIKE